MKAWHIAFKDTLARFRDRNGLLLMLVAPLVLAAVMGAAFGGFSNGSGSAPLQHIPLAIVNADRGDLGRSFADALHSAALAELLAPRDLADLDAARALVAKGEVRAAVYIPAGFSDAVQAFGPGASRSATVALYTDPTSPISAMVVDAVVTQIASGFNTAAIGGRLAVQDLLSGGLNAYAAPALANGSGSLNAALTEAISQNVSAGQHDVRLATRVAGASGRQTNPLAYFAPSMAVLFLMFTLFDAARSILEEEREGTLGRLIASPTGFAAVLVGKIGGVFLTGVAQLAVLVLASGLLFRLSWGTSPAGLALMVVAVVAAASSLGALIVAISRDERQAAIAGSAIALIFAILGGNFVESSAYPAWLQPLSRLTINRWALDGLTDLTLRGLGMTDILLPAGVLLAAAVLFFALALWRLPRRFVR